jgi:hypothetical protein
MVPSSSLLVRVVVPSSTRCGAVPSSSWRVVVTVPSRSSGLASGRRSAVVESARRSPDDELARLEAVFGLARLGAGRRQAGDDVVMPTSRGRVLVPRSSLVPSSSKVTPRSLGRAAPWSKALGGAVEVAPRILGQRTRSQLETCDQLERPGNRLNPEPVSLSRGVSRPG